MSGKFSVWRGVGVAALIGAAALAGCGDSSPAPGQEESAAAQAEAPPAAAHAGHAAAEAKTVGGEGEGAAAGDPATDDVAWLTQLGLMRGHLFVGMALYHAGALDHARTHMKHPESELYSGLVPAFEARGVRGFAPELSALASAVEGGAPAAEVEAAYATLRAAIAEAEVAARAAGPAERLRVAVNLVRTAGVEYGVGVVEGKIVNAHEYQDAYGFTQVAKEIVAGIAPGDDAALAGALSEIRRILDGLDGAWPSVTPPASVDTDASLLHGAAARIEIAALGVKRGRRGQTHLR